MQRAASLCTYPLHYMFQDPKLKCPACHNVQVEAAKKRAAVLLTLLVVLASNVVAFVIRKVRNA